MLTGIGLSLSDLASSKDMEDGEDEKENNEDTELGKLNNDGKPDRVMRSVSKTEKQRMESV